MGKFNNNLDTYLNIVQHQEQLESIIEKHKKDRRDTLTRLAVSTGALATGAVLSTTTGEANPFIISVASLALINSLYGIKKYSPGKLDYKIDHNNIDKIDYQALRKSIRERNRRNGKLVYNSPSNYYRQDPLEVDEEFGYPSDNDLPIHFLKKEEVPERLIREYELYNLKYELPELQIDQSELTTIIDIMENWLKKFTLSQRIYTYTSQYLSLLYAKGLINYWDEITINDFIKYLYIFESDDISITEIQNLKEQLTNELLNKQKNQTLKK